MSRAARAYAEEVLNPRRLTEAVSACYRRLIDAR
jgi:hypothetical protein